MGILVLNEPEIRRIVTLSEAIPAMEEAFVAYSQKRASIPSVIHLDVPDRNGAVHVKAGYIHGAPEYAVKIASGFWENRKKDLPAGSGMMLVFHSETGFLAGILLDNGYLTELRTAAAGAVAAKHMSSNNVEQVAIIGAGVQGRFQLAALSLVRNFQRIRVYDHHSDNIGRYRTDMQSITQAQILSAATPQEALKGSRIVITCTPSRSPILKGEWIERGMHITAMGSDDAGKQELDVSVLAKANRIVADSLPQCLNIGEIHHAVAAGVLREKDVDGELGDVISGRIPGRTRDDEITVCDLTGVGVQDAAIAGLVFRRASAAGIGRNF